MNSHAFRVWSVVAALFSFGSLSTRAQTPDEERPGNPTTASPQVLIDTKTAKHSLLLDPTRIVLVRMTDVPTIAPTDEAARSWERSSRLSV
jgi:hypothetical protein